ncbi:lysoplasmalogenase family protein [Hydrogenophaga pseudoflava]|uniref:lysoplasmalogenase family protein n=1 Tax=Hydrogenophaga pseudoflava TaxID=47421 RepID=UPI0027E411FD|nr:lysoplasmalogenase family protein [Hydrogenophaga pseudoflava]MDQ7743678.1 lysoplasmalogenase family protein [Hydrogenophaga pseudoflava]
MSPNQVIVLATPVFLLLIALEFWVGRRRGRNTYALADTLNSVGLGMLSRVADVFTLALRLGIYVWVQDHAALWRDDAFWTSPAGWLLALVFYDFLYYWNHRLGHEVGVLWAAHVVHHQSQHYNLSTALRQPASYALLGWVFYLPMALAGVPPLVFAVVGLVDLLYQFWIHTEQIGSLGPFDRWFASPSNHRVHHAVNGRYLDKNYGGILMLWDHLFGSFEPEDPKEPCVYGTRKPLDSWDPVWANAEVYAAQARDSAHTARWRDRLRTWLRPPGWRAADVAARWPAPAFDLATVQRFDPPAARGTQALAALVFVLLLGGVAFFLWTADARPLTGNLPWTAALLAGLWAQGALLQGRIGPGLALMVLSAAVATLAAAEGWTGLHRVFKPLTMLVAIGLVLRADGRGRGWLLAALVGSLVGDAFLMFDGFFIAGLASFLLAHLAYIVRLRSDAPWFADRRALWAVGAVGLAMYALLWSGGPWGGGLPAGLRAPVAAYVLAIALMASQALGRARVHASPAAWCVAAGALCFMASDALLATDRFLVPLPARDLLVLASYYAAQCLMVAGLLREAPRQGA